MKAILIFLALFCTFALYSQVQGDGGEPKSYKLSGTKSIPLIDFLEPDIEGLRAEDAIIDAEKSGPWRFGFNNETNINLSNSGSWSNLSNGGKVWRVRLHCKNALTVNLTLENVKLPEGNEFYVYNEDKSFILGKFTAYHLYNGNLGTELVPGNTVIAEYYVAPKNTINDASLTISRVTHGYRTAEEFSEKAFGSSGSCNMNVNCADGLPWEAQKRGAVMLVSGSNGFCSGSMINNTLNDGKPYVLTANHCYSDPTNWIFRFNWEAPSCINPGASPTNFESLSGAVLRSRRTPTDFCLVEITGGLISGEIPATIGTYFSGWNNLDNAATNTIGIHHPKGDIKKISFDDNPVISANGMNSSEANSQWKVVWDRGTTTEGGSSGSPLFDNLGRIVGQLWGGFASCSQPLSADYYGKISKSWEPVGSDSTNQLKYWLDPTNTGATVMDGYDPSNPPAADNAGINSVLSPKGNYCDAVVTPEFELRNFGNNNLTSVTINYNIDGGVNTTINWTGNLAPGTNETITLPTMTMADGSHTFTVFTTMPNGMADSVTANDSSSTFFTTSANGQDVMISVSTDCWGNETTWEVKDQNANVILSSGGSLGNEITEVTLGCFAFGCYDFIIYDSFGDGMNGSTQSGCTTDGSYTITDQFGFVLASIIQLNFGASETNNFCVTNNSGISENVNKDFSLFPNPSNGSFKILFNEFTENTEICVTDISGRIVYKTDATSEVVEIELPQLATGNYLVTIKTNLFNVTRSIQISK